MTHGRGTVSIILLILLLCETPVHGFSAPRRLSSTASRSWTRSTGEASMSRSDGRYDRRALLVPAIGSLGLGGYLLVQQYRDDQLYEAKHRELFEHVNGPNILEVGIGDAPNICYYKRGVQITGIDPFVSDGSILSAETRARARGLDLKVLRCAAEEMPFEDETFDNVVSTLVFCTVKDPVKALQEVIRVLKPGGSFAFFEHVAAPEDSFLHQEQVLLDPLQALLAGGCHLVRRTDALFKESSGDGDRPRLLRTFSRIEKFDYVEQPSKWLIAPQITGILIK